MPAAGSSAGSRPPRRDGDAEPSSSCSRSAQRSRTSAGEYARAAAYQAEIERPAPERRRPARRFPAAARSSSPCRTPSPRPSPASTRRPRSTRSSRTSSRPWSRPTPQGNLAPQLCERWALRGRRRRDARCTCGPGFVFSDGSPLDRGRRQVRPRALDPALPRRDAGRLRRDRGRARVSRRKGAEPFPGIDVASDDELRIRLAAPGSDLSRRC